MIAAEAVVTFERPDGFDVVRSLGPVAGEGVAPRNFFRDTVRGIGAFIGVTPLEVLTDAERARGRSLAALLERAGALGANGIVGLRFEASRRADGSTLVLARGEAVILDPVPGERS